MRSHFIHCSLFLEYPPSSLPEERPSVLQGPSQMLDLKNLLLLAKISLTSHSTLLSPGTDSLLPQSLVICVETDLHMK